VTNKYIHIYYERKNINIIHDWNLFEIIEKLINKFGYWIGFLQFYI